VLLIQLKSANSFKNILNSIEISVLFFNFEIKFLIFSKNIQIGQKLNTSPEVEQQLSLCHHPGFKEIPVMKKI